MLYAFWVVSVSLAGFRLAGERGVFFQALAHLVVGVAFGVGATPGRRSYLWPAIALTVVEVFAFLTQQ